MGLQLNLGDICLVRLGYRDGQGSVAYNILHYRFQSASSLSGAPPLLQRTC